MTTSLRTLVVTPWWPRFHEDVSGSFIAAQVHALNDLGVNTDVVVVGPDAPAKDSGIQYVPFRWLPRYLGWGMAPRVLAPLLRLAHLDGGEHDLVHVHEETLGMAVRRALPEYPMIVTVHGRVTVSRVQRSRLRRRDIERLGKSAHIVCVGEPVLCEWTGADPPPVVVHNGFETNRFVPTPLPKGSTLRVVSVSNLQETKRVDTTVRAVALACQHGANVRLDVIGDGPEGGRLRRLTRELGVEQAVAFHGRLARSAVADQIRRAHLFCLPSVSEAFGIVYVEALGSARPAIGCYGQGAEAIIDHGVDGWLVPPDSVADIADILGKVAGDRALLAEMGERGAQKAHKRFSWRVSTEALLAVYRDAISGVPFTSTRIGHS